MNRDTLWILDQIKNAIGWGIGGGILLLTILW